MKKALFLVPLLLSTLVYASTNDDAFNAGASFGKGNAAQGTGSLKNPGTVTGDIPGYTANPPQSGYYNGPDGGDGGLTNAGQAAIGNSEAGQAVIDSGTKNPPPVIDPNSPFITIGKNAENNAGSIVDGTNSQCTQTNVSKSVFEKYSCSRDLALNQTCVRTGKADGIFTGSETIKEATINSSSLYFEAYTSDSAAAVWTVPAGLGGEVISGTIDVYRRYNKEPNQDVIVFGTRVSENAGVRSFTPNYTTRDGEQIRFIIGYMDVPRSNAGSHNNGNISWVMKIKVRVSDKKFTPQVTWSTSCPSGSPDGKKLSTTCTAGAGNKQVVKDGTSYSVYSDCWQYKDVYQLSAGTNGTCSKLMSNAACTKTGSVCSEKTNGSCTHQDETWECQKVYNSGGLLCGGQYFCKTGDCSDTTGAGDSGFDTAVAKLAGLASAAADVTEDQINVKAFTGDKMSCRKAFAGFSNCCKDSGWGSDAGLAACNDDELALGKAKAKKVTVSVGERCDKEVLGVCMQKSQVYCVFQGKLARIIQEQGRRDQLKVNFGSGKSPNCRGITVDELQKIDFDRINFSDFYEDLMNSQKIPNTATMTKLVKDRIAGQVKQQQMQQQLNQQSGAAK